MTNPSDKCVYAYTPPGDDFPAFVILSRRESGGYTLTVRSQGNAGRDVGSIDLFPEAVEALATGALFDLRRGNRPHEQRVIAECNDLVDRLKRLIAFMRSPAFGDLDIAEQSRLHQQRHLMGQLSIVLTARVAAFKAAPQHPLDNDGATTLPEASPATKGQCNDERACGACFSGQGERCGGCLERNAYPSEVNAVLNLYAPHEQRVIKEYIELGNRGCNLTKFVGSSAFVSLSEEDQELLTEQLVLMNKLQAILVKRINRFKPLSDESVASWYAPCGADRGETVFSKPDSPAGVKIECGSPDVPISTTCQGTNCGATDGVSHSAECVTEAAKTQGWDTKVSWTVIDRSNPATLPPKGDWLVTVDDDGERELMEARHHGGGIWHSHSGFLYDPIIAWAPRPEAYSGPVPSEG